VSRFGAGEVAVTVTERGNRLLVSWWAADEATFFALRDSLRAAFPYGRHPIHANVVQCG
jgi:hypothetical protein